jgi:hypothetical protein
MVQYGILDLSPDFNTIDFIVYGKGINWNLNEKLNCMLTDEVSVVVQHRDKKVLDAKGQLMLRTDRHGKRGTKNMVRDYYIGDVNLTDKLWKLTGENIEIEIQCEEVE